MEIYCASPKARDRNKAPLVKKATVKQRGPRTRAHRKKDSRGEFRTQGPGHLRSENMWGELAAPSLRTLETAKRFVETRSRKNDNEGGSKKQVTYGFEKDLKSRRCRVERDHTS